MNTYRLEDEKDVAVQIEISDEACLRFKECDELVDQNRFADLDCAECPLGLEIFGKALCEIEPVQYLINMRLNQLDEKGERK